MRLEARMRMRARSHDVDEAGSQDVDEGRKGCG
jgi:hypothetical protein